MEQDYKPSTFWFTPVSVLDIINENKREENKMKSGIRTSEFWLAAVAALVAAILALFVGYGMVTSEQSDLWAGLILAAAPIAIAIISASYSSSRAKVKSGE